MYRIIVRNAQTQRLLFTTKPVDLDTARMLQEKYQSEGRIALVMDV